MPISGPSSYVPTALEFISNWGNADAQLGPGNEIVLQDGSTLADLTAKKDALVAKRSDVQDTLNDKEGARASVEIKKKAMIGWIVEFNKKVRAFHAGTKYEAMLPDAPSQGDAQSKILDPLDDANSIWQKINADPGTATPMTLIGGYDQAMFAADIAALQSDYAALKTAENNLVFVRAQRNELQDQIYAILLSYRKALPTFFVATDPIVISMPRLTPLPGSTPSAVVATGVWDPVALQSKITWTPSSDPNLLEYEIRFVTGPDYTTQDESISGTVLPGGTLEHFTVDGMVGPGTTASYKVYVVLNTGNEKGSNAVSVTQPGP